ncbi:hypothetical protein QOZ83_04020 [Romboutsia sedimentorum]|uniref:hypothetical protein n=1 Tax=Romboutsia sedimentorum TaxID=1368474 RepID=UPI0024DEDA76|nr:hypothetical protein [Romboutsia sedimentorum]MDK2585017.1 hypothetical protein [Romboutsia sedimentorum]
MSKDIKRINVTLKSEDSKTLSGWQLQEFIKNINKGYNKLDLTNEISRLINEGKKPENIIIINKSYDINNAYTYLQKSNEIDLNKSSMVENLYHLGIPVSMYPNKRIKEIGVIFSLYRNIYTLFRSENIPVIEKDKLKEYINLDIYKAISMINQESRYIMSKLKTANENILKATSDKLDNIVSSAKVEISEYIADEYDMLNFKKIDNIELKKLKDTDKYLYTRIQSRYYSKFFELLNDIDRPIILLYEEQSNKLRVVKKEYMLNDIESENFLDFKDYSHNSPFVITIIAGVAISSIVALLYNASKEDEANTEKEKKNKKIEKEIDKNIKDVILELANSTELNQVNEVEDKFINNKLDDLKNGFNENIEKTLDRRGISNDIVISIEEYKKSRQ